MSTHDRCSAYVALFLLFQSCPAIPIRNFPKLRTPIVSLEEFCDLAPRGSSLDRTRFIGDLSWTAYVSPACGIGRDFSVHCTNMTHISDDYIRRRSKPCNTGRYDVLRRHVDSQFLSAVCDQTYAGLDHSISVSSKLAISVLA